MMLAPKKTALTDEEVRKGLRMIIGDGLTTEAIIGVAGR